MEATEIDETENQRNIQCRKFLGYSFALFCFTILWISIIQSHQLPAIVFAVVFTVLFLLSCFYFRWVRLRNQDNHEAHVERDVASNESMVQLNPDDRRLLLQLNSEDRATVLALLLSRQNIELLARRLNETRRTHLQQQGLSIEEIGFLPITKYLIDAEKYAKPTNDIAITLDNSEGREHGVVVAGDEALVPIESRPQTEAAPVECSICLAQLKLGELIVTLPCCHFYHKECIFEWLHSKVSCPLCKQSIGSGRTRRNRTRLALFPAAPISSSISVINNPSSDPPSMTSNGDVWSEIGPNSIHEEFSSLEVERGKRDVRREGVVYDGVRESASESKRARDANGTDNERIRDLDWEFDGNWGRASSRDLEIDRVSSERTLEWDHEIEAIVSATSKMS